MSDGICPREEFEQAFEHAEEVIYELAMESAQAGIDDTLNHEDLTALVESIRGDLDLIATNLEGVATNQLTKQQASALRQWAQQAAGKALMLAMGAGVVNGNA